MNEEELRSCATSARENLADLIADPAERARVDRGITAALGHDAGTAALPLRLALRSHEATARFLQIWAADSRSKRIIDADRVVGPLGDPTSIIGVLFMCPKCDHTEVLDAVADEDLTCPNDGSPLMRVDG